MARTISYLTRFSSTAIVFVFVAFAFVITLCTKQPPTQVSRRLPYSDNPPKYRETWRRQHLESCSQATDTFTMDTTFDTQGTTATNLSRLDVRSLFKFTSLPGVHQPQKRSTSMSMVNANQGELGISNTRLGRANTDPRIYISDDGLPSYEEALSR